MIILKNIIFFLFLLGIFICATFGFAATSTITPAQDTALVKKYSEDTSFDWKLHFASRAHFQNDTDFDRTEFVYSNEGQSAGALSTFAYYQLYLAKFHTLSFQYEGNAKSDVWSQHIRYPDAAYHPNIWIKHRKLWALAKPFEHISVGTGLRKIEDRSGLFANHYAGAGGFEWFSQDDSSHVSLIIGQIPEQTYEGFSLSDNNFNHDTWLFFSEFSRRLSSDITFTLNGMELFDRSRVNHTVNIITFLFGAEYKKNTFKLEGFVLPQIGNLGSITTNGNNAHILSFSALLKSSLQFNVIKIESNTLIFSADDNNTGNNVTSFYSSGQKPLNSLILDSENIGYISDNLENLFAQSDRHFYEMPAGLGYESIGLFWNPCKYQKAGIVSTASFALNSYNAGDSSLYYLKEEFLLQRGFLKNAFRAGINSGVIFPGNAGARFINRVDAAATDYLWYIHSGLSFDFEK